MIVMNIDSDELDTRVQALYKTLGGIGTEPGRLVRGMYHELLKTQEENNLLHDALTKLQARYDETEASLFQHMREKEAALAELEAAVYRAQEAEYAYKLLAKQAGAFHAENGRLRQKQERTTTIARPYSGGLDCEGDGSGPGCENRAVWEIQDMQDDGSNYVYVCDRHLSDYQRWANSDGRSPLVFETD